MGRGLPLATSAGYSANDQTYVIVGQILAGAGTTTIEAFTAISPPSDDVSRRRRLVAVGTRSRQARSAGIEVLETARDRLVLRAALTSTVRVGG